MINVPTVRINASLAEIVDLLVSHTQRRVVVVDDQRRVVGIITDGDLIKRATAAAFGGIIQSLTRRLLLEQNLSQTEYVFLSTDSLGNSSTQKQSI